MIKRWMTALSILLGGWLSVQADYARQEQYTISADGTISLGDFLPDIRDYYRCPVSQARWIWVRKADDPYARSADVRQVFAEGPRRACLRLKFNIDEPVRRAWIRYIMDKRGRGYLNGQPLARIPDKTAAGVYSDYTIWYLEIGAKLKPGENVLAFDLSANPVGWRGLLMTGEIEFASGKKIALYSSPEFKGSDVPAANWMMSGFDDSKWGNAWEQGDVRMGPYQINSPIAKFFCTPQEYEKYSAMVAEECGKVAHLKKESTPQGKIVYGGEQPSYCVNGKALPPVVYLTFAGASENRDNIVAKMYAAGVRIFMFGLPNEKLYSSPETEWVVDLGISRLLTLAPEAYFIISDAVMQEKEWLKANPDERVEYSNPVKPKTGGRLDDDGYYGGQLAPSFASEAYRRHIADKFIRFAKYASGKPWGNRIIGFQIGYGPSGDGIPFGVVNGMPDCGKRMTEAFRRYLTEKYRNDAALQKAWNDPAVTLATAVVPDKQQRLGAGHFLHDPVNPADCRLVDYYRCYHREFGNFIIAIGKYVKTALPGRMFGSYFGYTMTHYPAIGVTSDCEWVLESPYVDWNFATEYGYHRIDCLHGAIPGIYRASGKLTSSEADIRTHIAFASRPDNLKSRMSTNPVQTEATVKKMLAICLLNGTGVHFNCFATTPDWFNTPAVLNPLAQYIRIWKECFRKAGNIQAEIAVVIDPVQRTLHGPPEMEDPKRLGNDNFFGLFYRGTLNALSYSGYTYEVISLNNFLAGKHNYKAAIFLNLYDVNGKTREALLKKVRKPGQTAIWFYAPGIISGKGFSDESMETLTGMKLAARFERLPLASRSTDGKRYYTKLIESPRVHCTDTAAEKLAVYDNSAEVSIARKQLADGSTAVFTGLPVIHSGLWADILSKAGCHAYVPAGTLIRANSKLLMLAVRKNGEYLVKLPGKVKKATDIFTNKTMAENTDVIRVNAKEWSTWLWELTY
ncbi:MAG: hypothetical protein PHV59_08655 [Victivallales bacterium]|nr:hypothetical protein [Victivallales bacterium]